MKAAVFHAPHQPLTIEDVEVDKPLSREVLVRTMASGVCHSDLHFVDGLYPLVAPAILGHEAAGIVEAVGPGHLRKARRPCHLLPLGLLRALRNVHQRAAEPLPQPGLAPHA